MNLNPQIEARLHDLPSKRRRVVVDGLDGFARELLEQSTSTDDLKKVELYAFGGLSSHLHLLLGASRFRAGDLSVQFPPGRFADLSRLLGLIRGQTADRSARWSLTEAACKAGQLPDISCRAGWHAKRGASLF